MPGRWLSSFLDALQATLSVLLVIFYGFLASHFNFLDRPSCKKISTICVRMFLPALMITQVGRELNQDTGLRYIPILVWALFYNLASIFLGLLAQKLFKLPRWVTPTLAFNTTTSLPLLLVQSLQSTGSLDHLLVGADTSSEAVARAQSYFLVNGIVSNSLIFSLGPRLMQPSHEQDACTAVDAERYEDEETANDEYFIVEADQVAQNDSELLGLLLHDGYQSDAGSEEATDKVFRRKSDHQTSRSSAVRQFLSDFFNEPFIGACMGTFIGLLPPLQRLFFNDPSNGGLLSAWFTTSLKNIGDLFVSLQVVVVGASLSSSVQKMRRGEASGEVPFRATSFVLLGRFVLWPVISILIIWVLATRTSFLGTDPILWFTMMLMPTGPPAMKLIAMADVGGVPELEKMSIAKLLTLSNLLSPVLALIVMGSLSASELIIGK